MGGRRSRNKGKRGERALAAWLRERGYPEARRGLTQSGGARECDVEGLPWWLEVKTGQDAARVVLGACRQAVRDTDGRPCLVVWRSQRVHSGPWGPWLVAVQGEATDQPDTRGVATVCRAGTGSFVAAGYRWTVHDAEGTLGHPGGFIGG